MCDKNNEADAAAICWAVTRPSMRTVLVDDLDQQAALMARLAQRTAPRLQSRSGEAKDRE